MSFIAYFDLRRLTARSCTRATRRPGGQKRKSVSPIRFPSGTGPKKRESKGLVRLSPITKTWPSEPRPGRKSRSSVPRGRRASGRGGAPPPSRRTRRAHRSGALPPCFRKTYDALYQRLLPAVGALEKDDVPAPGFFEILSELVDQSPVPHLKRRDHALRPDVERARDDGRTKPKTSVKEFRRSEERRVGKESRS